MGAIMGAHVAPWALWAPKGRFWAQYETASPK